MTDATPDRPNALTVSLIILGLFAALAISTSACKVPPIATAYRAHGLLITARDGGGELLAKLQRAKMVKCEADHDPTTPPGKAALIACLKQAREPVALWVRTIKPAVTAVAAGLWLAIEAAYVAGRKDLDKLAKASLIACSSLRAAEATLIQYTDKLGSLKALLLAAVAGGRILVCL